MNLQKQAVEIAEAARERHHAIASDPDPAVAGSSTKPYKHSLALFKAAIAVAYPDVDAEDVYDVWLDCMESVAHCAAWVRENEPLYATSMYTCTSCGKTVDVASQPSHLDNDCVVAEAPRGTTATAVSAFLRRAGFMTSYDRRREGIRVTSGALPGTVRVSVDFDSEAASIRLAAAVAETLRERYTVEIAEADSAHMLVSVDPKRASVR